MQNKSLREIYGNYLVQLGEIRDDFVTLDADMCGATFVDIFRKKFPDRHLRFGIAEQNMMCAAAGISTTGLIPIVNTMAVFAVMRALEMFRTSIAMSNFNVKVVASHQGLDVGNDGPTHQCIEDMAIMRAIPNTIVLSPADSIELQAMMRFMLDHKGPVYLRTGRSPVNNIHDDSYEFVLGRWPIIRQGSDIALVVNGILHPQALEAANILEKQGISVLIINASTIKPVDEEHFINSVKHTKAVITIEDHTIMGGLGSLAADILCRHFPMRLEKIGVRDCFGESGLPEELFCKYGMDTAAIISTVKNLLNND